MSARIAVIQKPPVLLDRDGTIGRAIEAIDEAADAGASLLVFPKRDSRTMSRRHRSTRLTALAHSGL